MRMNRHYSLEITALRYKEKSPLTERFSRTLQTNVCRKEKGDFEHFVLNLIYLPSVFHSGYMELYTLGNRPVVFKLRHEIHIALYVTQTLYPLTAESLEWQRGRFWVRQYSFHPSDCDADQNEPIKAFRCIKDFSILGSFRMNSFSCCRNSRGLINISETDPISAFLCGGRCSFLCPRQ